MASSMILRPPVFRWPPVSPPGASSAAPFETASARTNDALALGVRTCVA